MKPNQFGESHAALLSRLSEKGTDILVERGSADKISAPFLFENGDCPVVGSVYSDLSIIKFEYDHKTFDFALSASVNIAEKCSEIKMHAVICDENDERIVFPIEEQTAHETTEMKYNKSGNLKDTFGGHPKDMTEVFVFLDLTYESGEQAHAVKAQFEDAIDVYHNFEHPKSQIGYIEFGPENGIESNDVLFKSFAADGATNKKDKSIAKIALFRKPWDTSDIDYFCNFGKCDPSKGDHPVLGIPVLGTLTLPEAYEIVNDEHCKPLITCTITEQGSGGVTVLASSEARYEKVGVPITFLQRNKFEYNLTRSSWGVIYMERGSLNCKKYDYTIEFSLYYKVNGGDKIPLHTKYSSGVEYLNCGTLPYIVLEWGCLAENTEILTVTKNGVYSTRRIKDISIGDRVVSADGTVQNVKNVWSGQETRCYTVTDEHGNSVTASYNHPFPTSEGWKCSSDIRVGDKLFGMNGDPVLIVKVQILNEQINVFNLEFDIPTVIIANGFQTGDYSAQNGNLPE